MLACLSPNGMNRYDGASAPDRLLVATSSGVTTLARESSGAWRKTGTALAGLHATTLTTLPGRPGIFVGTHGDGVLFSEDGARWEERDSGLAFKDVYTVASVAEAGGSRRASICTPIRDSLRAIGRPGAGGASIEFVSRSTHAEQARNPGSRGSNSPAR